MKTTISKSVLILFSMVSMAGTYYLANERAIEADYSISFDTRTTEGTFGDLSGIIVWDENDLSAAKFDVTVEVSTIQTGNDLKDEHARSDTWFDAENHPQIRIKSTAISKSDEGYLMKGVLEMRGKAKEVVIPFTVEKEGEKEVFSGSFQVDRTEFEVGSGMRSWVVGDEIDVKIKVPTSIR
jgi:polyisoprenoid-binding protein YceI